MSSANAIFCLNGHYVGLLTVARHVREWQATMTRRERDGAKGHAQFCTTCGAANINACQHCQTPIEIRHSGDRPAYCGGCGKPFPWQESAIENLKAVLQESNLSAQELQEAENALPDVLRETAKTESASLKLKRIMGKLGKPLYDVAIKVITDVASESAKKTLGLK